MIVNPVVQSGGGGGGNSPFVEVSTLAEVFDQPDRPQSILPGVAVLLYSAGISGIQPALFIDVSKMTSTDNSQMSVSWIGTGGTTFTIVYRGYANGFVIQDDSGSVVLAMTDFSAPPSTLKDGYNIKFYKYLG